MDKNSKLSRIKEISHHTYYSKVMGSECTIVDDEQNPSIGMAIRDCLHINDGPLTMSYDMEIWVNHTNQKGEVLSDGDLKFTSVEIRISSDTDDYNNGKMSRVGFSGNIDEEIVTCLRETYDIKEGETYTLSQIAVSLICATAKYTGVTIGQDVLDDVLKNYKGDSMVNNTTSIEYIGRIFY